MERSVVPEKLCLEIIQVCEQNANSPTLPTAIPTGEFNKDYEKFEFKAYKDENTTTKIKICIL